MATQTENMEEEGYAPGDIRLVLLQANNTKLKHLAWQVLIEQGRKNSDVVLVCIQVDSIWKYVVDELMPGNEERWQEVRDNGNMPNVVGTMLWDFCHQIADDYPDLSKGLLKEPEDGVVKGLVLTSHGCLVIDVEPKVNSQMLQ